MQKRRMWRRCSSRAGLLLEKLCPLSSLDYGRPRKALPIRRGDQRVYYSGWRTIKSAIARRAYEHSRAKNGHDWYKVASLEKRKAANRKRYERRKKNNAAYRKQWNAWYARNKQKYCEQERRRKLKRDPTRGLFTLSQQFRKGEISIDELTRRCSDALSEIHEIDRKRLRSSRATPGLPHHQRGSKPSKSNSRSSESKVASNQGSKTVVKKK